MYRYGLHLPAEIAKIAEKGRCMSKQVEMKFGTIWRINCTVLVIGTLFSNHTGTRFTSLLKNLFKVLQNILEST